MLHRRRLQLERLESRRLLAAGDLDPTFSDDGIAPVFFAANPSGAESLVRHNDNKLVVAGHARNDTLNEEIAVARLNVDGTLDTTFGGDGTVTTPFAEDAFAYEAAVQSNGRIVVAGKAFDGENDLAVVVRYNADGTLDDTFGGGDGIVTLGLGVGDTLATALAIQPDGRIVIAGTYEELQETGEFGRTTAFRNIFVARFHSNGDLDPGLDTDGVALVEQFDRTDVATDVALQSNGKIVVSGYARTSVNSNTAAILLRFNHGGAIDSEFGVGGVVNGSRGFDDEFNSVAIQSDGKIVAAGASQVRAGTRFMVSRFNQDGTVDTSFNSGGTAFTRFDRSTLPPPGYQNSAYDVGVQSDGKIVASGDFGQEPSFAMARYLPNGTLDSSFGGDGKVTNGSIKSVRGLALHPLGKIAVAGTSDSSAPVMRVARYLGGLVENQAPVLNGIAGTVSYDPQGQAVLLAPLAVVRDDRGHFGGGRLVVGIVRGGIPNDRLEVTGPFAIDESNQLTFNGSVIGTVNARGGEGDIPLVFHFSDDATVSIVQELVRRIRYRSEFGGSFPRQKVVWFTLSDGEGGQSFTRVKRVHVA